jgi:thiamine pyrophosphate-dependent acetolactate synthase large subunit-like protein
MRYDDPERIERIARRAYQIMYVNTGALLKIDFDKDVVSVAAVSASGHHSPRYPFSAEAPRVYDDAPVTLEVWREWVKRVIESESDYGSH